MPYEERAKRKPDFRVRYRLYSREEGGIPLYQGIRSNFWYEHPDHKKHNQSLFSIFPEFEDKGGEVIIDTTTPVPTIGTARMWIPIESFVSYHKGKIKIGTTGHFKAGGRPLGECEVIELINIAEM